MSRLALCCALLAPAMALHAATITVPGDYATIHDAIQNAADGSVVQLAAGHYHEQIKLDGDGRSLVLRGDPANPSAVVLDGDGAVASVIRLQSCTGWLTVEGVTVTGGHGSNGYGGGMGVYASSIIVRDSVLTANTSDTNGGGLTAVDSAVVLQRVLVQGNAAGQLGGGVALLRAKPPTGFQQCQFVGNNAGVSDPTFAGGGGLCAVDSSAILDGCIIENNRSAFEGGGLVALGTWDHPESVVRIRDTTIAGNVTYRGSTTSPGAEGGGIHNEDNATVILERSRVAGNHANLGGGLMTYRGRYEIIDSVIENNVVASEGIPGGTGGGIAAASTNPAPPARRAAAIALSHSVVRGNTAESAGGIFVQGDLGITSAPASLDVTDSLITDNAANGGRDGGGIFAVQSATTLQHSMLLRNRTDGNGAGLMATSSSLAVDDATIADNVAGSAGGGIFVAVGGQLAVGNSRIVGNSAGAPANAGGSGAIFVGEGLSPGGSPPVTGSVTGSVIADNGPNLEIAEPDCDATAYSQVAYTGNTIHTSATLLYSNVCTSSVTTVAQFNAIAGKASGNVAATPDFAAFVAAPATIRAGTASVLGWGASALPLTISPVVGALGSAHGTQDVSPALTTTYSLTTSGRPVADATVTVLCSTLYPPLLMSPTDGEIGRGATVTLTWLPAIGAATYDVYLDTSDDPTTVVAHDLTDTTAVVGSLAPNTGYRWKVLARSPSCADPLASTVYSFQTCADGNCEFTDGFDDGDASDWSHDGVGTAQVTGGQLLLRTPRMLTVRPPFRAFTDGRIEVSLGLPSGKSQAHLLFAYRDKRTYRELVVRGSGRVDLLDHASGRRRVTGHLRSHGRLAGSQPIAVRIDLAGADARVSLNGSQVLTGTFPSPAAGTFGVRVVHGAISIDDVHLVVE